MWLSKLSKSRLEGQQIGRLKVISRFEKDSGGSWIYLCKCSCGNKCLVCVSHLKSETTRSCGCLRSETASKAASARKGELNHAWRGGISTEEQKLRGSGEMKKWRQRCLDRDGNICQICGSCENLEAHHLNSFIDNPTLRFEDSNGITICVDCHDVFHSEYGNGGNTSEQFQEFKKSLGI